MVRNLANYQEQTRTHANYFINMSFTVMDRPRPSSYSIRSLMMIIGFPSRVPLDVLVIGIPFFLMWFRAPRHVPIRYSFWITGNISSLPINLSLVIVISSLLHSIVSDIYVPLGNTTRFVRLLTVLLDTPITQTSCIVFLLMLSALLLYCRSSPATDLGGVARY